MNLRRLAISVLFVLVACTDTLTAPASKTRTTPTMRASGSFVVDGMTDLGSFGGGAYAYAINDAGDIVGSSAKPGFYDHATLWSNGSITDLGTLGGDRSDALDINAIGQIVGDAQLSWGGFRAVLWQPGGVTDLGTLGGANSLAYGINTTGQVVGMSETLGGPYHAFLWANGSMTDLGTLGGPYSYARKINDHGDIVGSSALPGGYLRAVLWHNGSAISLGTLGGPYSEAFDINNSGQIVGASLTESGAVHAFLWGNGIFTDLGTLGGSFSEARGVNDAGEVVGESTLVNGATHAFVWRDGEMTDLGALGTHSWAFDVNSSRMIVGFSAGSRFVPTLWSVVPPNAAPIITGITLPASPIPVGTAVNVPATFTDEDASDTHSAAFDWEGETSGATSIIEPSSSSAGTVLGSHSYSAAGVYTVVVTVNDGKISSQRSSALDQPAYIVVYDANAGFVTGSGWITSPDGACNAAGASDTSVCSSPSEGRATFGFVSKYLKGATRPVGTTEFQFTTGRFAFSSSAYDWLVVAGARAQYKGAGTVNGKAGYDFILTAVDGQIINTRDQFRIKVIERATGIVVYDNRRGADDDAADLTALGGGSIVIHK